MKFANPTYIINSPVLSSASIRGTANWREDPIALFGNSKPNAMELLQGIKAKLSQVRRVDNVHFFSKPSASIGAGEVLLEQISNRCKIAILALGD